MQILSLTGRCDAVLTVSVDHKMWHPVQAALVEDVMNDVQGVAKQR